MYQSIHYLPYSSVSVNRKEPGPPPFTWRVVPDSTELPLNLFYHVKTTLHATNRSKN